MTFAHASWSRFARAAAIAEASRSTPSKPLHVRGFRRFRARGFAAIRALGAAAGAMLGGVHMSLAKSPADVAQRDLDLVVGDCSPRPERQDRHGTPSKGPFGFLNRITARRLCV
jgi:hypothetical protein